MPLLGRQPWSLPAGVSRSLWEYAHDPAIARDDPEHLAGSPLIDLDSRLVHEWLAEPGPLIDLGCGPGRLSLPLARRRFSVLAVDLSPAALECVRQQAQREQLPIGLLRANLCNLGCVPDRVFDTALMMFGTLGMIEGRDNRKAALEHARRVLRPGGRLILHAHNVWRHLFNPATRGWLLRDRIAAMFGSTAAGDTRRDYRGIPGMYHHAFSWRELRGLLQSAGFRVRDVVAVHPDPPNPERIESWWSRRIRCAGWIVRAERSNA